MLFEEMEVLYPFALYKRPPFALAKKFQRGRLLDICIAALLLKQISMIVMLGTMFQHVLRISVRCWI
jgi:hypothetical protein